MFEEPLLRGAVKQPSFSGIQINHFLEKRGREISLDRMGQSSLDRKVMRFLESRARAHGQNFAKPQEFNGWVRVAAKEITQPRGPGAQNAMPIIPSPIDEPEPNDNPYHAHIERPEALDAYVAALHLRHVFTTNGVVERNADQQPTWNDWIRGSLNAVRAIIEKALRKRR